MDFAMTLVDKVAEAMCRDDGGGWTDCDWRRLALVAVEAMRDLPPQLQVVGNVALSYRVHIVPSDTTVFCLNAVVDAALTEATASSPSRTEASWT